MRDQSLCKERMNSLRPILITGLPRTGTTWASRAVAAVTRGRLVHEPFNWKLHPDRVGYHMKYMPAGSKDAVLLKILRDEIKPRILSLNALRRARQVVIKDVHICLAIEYLWEELRPNIVILVRHPCAMANSWANLGLEARSRLDLLLSQERLARDHLAPFESHIHSNDDCFFEIGAYWGASYFVMGRLAERHEDWQWISHESLCVEPLAGFERLVKDMGLGVDHGGHNSLRNFLRKNDRPRKRGEGPYSLTRVSAKEPGKWRSALTSEQVHAVMAGAEPFGVLTKLYSDQAVPSL
jgi:hypothetical protein